MDWLDRESIGSDKRPTQWAIAISLLVLVLITLDIAGDYRDGVLWQHLLIEWSILMLALVGVIYFGNRYYRLTQNRIGSLKHDLALANQQAQHWRAANRELIAGLAAQIQSQFESWQLTPR